jgi:YaaC-like Protein
VCSTSGGRPREPAELDAYVEGLPDTYPTTLGLTQDGTRVDVLGSEDRVFTFPGEDGLLRPLHEVGVRARNDEPYGDFLVRPKIGTDAIGPPSEFLTLWALLFCLSELARYYPDTWVVALDPDISRDAVTFEHGLDLALERAPRLISSALGGPIGALMREEIRRRERERASGAEGNDAQDAAGAEPEDPPLPEARLVDPLDEER